MGNSRTESCCLLLCCFNLLHALQKEAFVSDAINFSALGVYGCEFNSRDINIYFSSIFTVPAQPRQQLGLSEPFRGSYYGTCGLSLPSQSHKGLSVQRHAITMSPSSRKGPHLAPIVRINPLFQRLKVSQPVLTYPR